MKFIGVLLFLLNQICFAQVEVGKPLPGLTLSEKEGGLVTGEPFNIETIRNTTFKGLTISIFYVDPEERKSNEPLEAAYKEEKLPFEKHGSIAIINMAAAWYPNAMLESQLKKKQEEFPKTIYVKDMNKKIVKSWGLADDSVNMMVVDPKGTVIHLKKSAVTDAEFKDLMTLIRKSFI